MTLLRLFLPAAFTVCLVLWPAYTFAALGAVMACGLIAAAWWLNQCRIEAREYQREHNL